MKKFLNIKVILLVVILAIAAFLFLKPKENVEVKKEDDVVVLGNVENKPEFSEVEKGVVYSGKVVPLQARYYVKDSNRKVEKINVTQGQEVSKDQVLFTYKDNNYSYAKINSLSKQNELLTYQDDAAYWKLVEKENELKGADKNDTNYVYYLEKEIATAKATMALNEATIAENKANIDQLREQNKTEITSEIDGIVYKVSEDNSQAPSDKPSAFITVFSKARKVRISVSEYEYASFYKGQKLKVKVDAMQKNIDAEVIFVDNIPNNLDNPGVSYYDVDISVSEDVPFGYTVAVRVENE